MGEEASRLYRAYLDQQPIGAGRDLRVADLFGVGIEELEPRLPRMEASRLARRLRARHPMPRTVEEGEATRRAHLGAADRESWARHHWTEAIGRSPASEATLNRLAAVGIPDLAVIVHHPNATVRTLAILLRAGVLVGGLEPFDRHPALRPQPWHEAVEDPFERYLLYLGHGRPPDLAALTRGLLCHAFDPKDPAARLVGHALRHHRALYEQALATADAPGRVGLAVCGLMSAVGAAHIDPRVALADPDGLRRRSLLALLDPGEGDEAVLPEPASLAGGLFEWLQGADRHRSKVHEALNGLLSKEELLLRHGAPQLAGYFIVPRAGYLSPLLERVLGAVRPEAMRRTWLAALERGAHRATLMLRQPDGARRFQQEDRWAFRAMVWLRGAFPDHAAYLLGLLDRVPAGGEAVTRFLDELRLAHDR